jgi:hypothetical protein
MRKKAVLGLKVSAGSGAKTGHKKRQGTTRVAKLRTDSKERLRHRNIRSLFNDFKARAKKRNLPWNIPFEIYSALIIMDCYICGAPPSSRRWDSLKFKHNGLDRIDSSEGYILGNVAPCCRTCNNAKRNLNIMEFIRHFKRAICNLEIGEGRHEIKKWNKLKKWAEKE